MTFTLARLLIAIALLASSSLAVAQNKSPNNSSSILGHVASVGPQQAIKDYYGNPVWYEILKGIASGKSDWIKVYAALRRGSDGAASEDLTEAISDAMPIAPFRILPVLHTEKGGHSSIKDLCIFGVEMSAGKTGVGTYVTLFEQSLKQANSPEQRSIRDACLIGIAEAKRNSETMNDVQR